MSIAVPLMPTAIPQGQAFPPTVFQISDHAARQAVIDSIRKTLIGRDADRYNDKSRNLLQKCVQLLPVDDQELIRGQYAEMRALEKKLADSPPWYQRIGFLMDYRRVAKETYVIVKAASNRIIDIQINDQLGGDQGPQAPAPPTAMPADVETSISASEPSHPFRSRGRSSRPFDHAAFSNVEKVDLTTLQSNATRDPVVLVELHERNQRIQQYLATLQPGPPDDDRTDVGSEPRMPDVDPAETSTIGTNELLGPSSDVNGENDF